MANPQKRKGDGAEREAAELLSALLALARQRMVQELLTDRRRHQAEQIFALNECARRAMEAEQFNAAVGAFRVIAEIGGLLRAPLKPPESVPGGRL